MYTYNPSRVSKAAKYPAFESTSEQIELVVIAPHTKMPRLYLHYHIRKKSIKPLVACVPSRSFASLFHIFIRPLSCSPWIQCSVTTFRLYILLFIHTSIGNQGHQLSFVSQDFADEGCKLPYNPKDSHRIFEVNRPECISVFPAHNSVLLVSHPARVFTS